VRYIHFVWDESKSRANTKKHGVSFEEARSAFFDDNARLMNDPDHSLNEDRFLLLGMSGRLRLLLVCHCYRENEEQIRIISARKATRLESTQYGRQ
jgi:uncharacterized DUF497 family protein